MAEIKSTLDLVMEKTRHLTLSREEKEKQTVVAFKKKLSGLLLQYADGKAATEGFAEDFDTLKRQFAVDAEKILINEILDRLTLQRPESRLTDLLLNICHVDASRLKSVFEAYQAALKEAARNRSRQIKAELASSRHISGSAVRPNLDADRQWHAEAESIWVNYDGRLDREKALLNSP